MPISREPTIADFQSFERIAIEWYVRIHAVPRLRESGGDPMVREDVLATAANPLLWKDEVLRYIDDRFRFPRCSRVDKSLANADKLKAEVVHKMGLPTYDPAGEILVAGTAAILYRHLLRPAHTLLTRDQKAAALIRSIVGCLLAETHEDEAMGVLSDDDNLPLGLWPLILERAWKTQYSVPAKRGPDSVYYLLRNAPGLQRGIRSEGELDHEAIEAMILEIRSNCSRLGIPLAGIDLLDRFKGVLDESARSLQPSLPLSNTTQHNPTNTRIDG